MSSFNHEIQWYYSTHFQKKKKKNLKIPSVNHKTNHIFGTDSTLVAFKREKNLWDCLICSKLNHDNNTVETSGTTSCHRPQCSTCSHVTFGNTIRGPLRNWNVLGIYTCISLNVIYAITCTHCEKIYIGKTKRRLADRFTEHLRSIKINSPGLPVAAHCISSEHSIFNAKVSVVTSCINDTNRKTEEKRLIYELGTKGLDSILLQSPLKRLNYINNIYIYLLPCFCHVTRHHVSNVSFFFFYYSADIDNSCFA